MGEAVSQNPRFLLGLGKNTRPSLLTIAENVLIIAENELTNIRLCSQELMKCDGVITAT